ncbi:MAG: hypothetical protein WC865_16975 [Bacteroidales bacterium]
MSTVQLDLWNDRIEDQWLSFEEAKAIVHTWGLEYQEDWAALISNTTGLNHPGIPPNPEFIYRHTGWKDWMDWLVHPDLQIPYTLFYEAREFTWCLRIQDEDAWLQFIRNEASIHKSYGLNIPSRPFIEYKGKGWVDWTDWLGHKIAFRNYEETKKFIHTLHLKSQEEWNAYCNGKLNRPLKKPRVIYRYPDLAYHGHGWISWKDWLG